MKQLFWLVLSFCMLTLGALAEGIPDLITPKNGPLLEFAPELESLTTNRPSPFLGSIPGLPADCPIADDAWIVWRDAAINRLLLPNLFPNGQLAIGPQTMVEKADEMQRFIASCSPVGVPVPLTNLARFVRNFGVMNYSDHQFGFRITDMEYITNVRTQVELPALLKSDAFLKALRNPATYVQAKKMIDDQNLTLPPDRPWQVVLYKSRFLTTPDAAGTFGRFFVFVPDGQFEKWIQFGIVTPGDPVRDINNLSIVSIGQPNADGLRPTAIIDHWRTYKPDGSIGLSTRYEAVNRTENCTMCHKTSPLAIRPAEEYTFNENGALVVNTVNPGQILEMLNAKISNEYGPPFYSGWNDLDGWGPTIGPSRVRDVSAIKACAAPEILDDQAATRVARVMKCENCHNTDVGGVGPINFPAPLTDRGHLLTYIRQGWMPPNAGAQLSVPERTGLENCLFGEYFNPALGTGTLIDWLKQVP